MKNRHLFIFGGSPPFSKKFGEKFADLALSNKGKVAILFIERDGWEEYMQIYTSILEEYYVERFVYLPLSPNTNHSTLEELSSCTGVIISGGETELYRDYIVDTPIGQHIIELYENGAPVAGFSAGALISPSNCVIPPIDNSRNEHLFLNGLGLIKDCVISVHFSKWEEEENLKAALARVNAPIGYGIDDDEGLYFENEVLSETAGDNYYIFK
ncbi:Type 1 glutamine amidotransferase-like domain-containing protein [Virgibacillus salinus]|uniref:Cyanophycinase n=1 Tax=Virgibacillus salinus TaxID=553311 RepID=A0A1H1DS25_9BACI|nr:Type 1 glutamine amidotransferase-like domain-containing protein [Virgibacillus salinus]SDQ79237.1 cyanophycinase [Virgibacillus salinus]